MNLDSNHVYGNRFVRIGKQGFNPATVTAFNRMGDEVTIWFVGSDDNYKTVKGADAELVWEYLTANSTELTAPKYIFCIYEDCDQTVPNQGDYCQHHVNMLAAEKEELPY